MISYIKIEYKAKTPKNPQIAIGITVNGEELNWKKEKNHRMKN